MMKLSENKKTLFLALTSVLLWSTVASAFKISLRYLNPVQLLFIADVTSIVVLLVFLVIRGDYKLLFTYRWHSWMQGVKYGFLNPFLYYLILLYAYDMLPAQQAQAINYTWAIALSLLAVPLLKQKIGLLQLISISVSYFGVLTICTNGNYDVFNLENGFGVVLALLSTLIWAFYWIMNTKDEREPVAGLLMNFICALPMITSLMFFSGSFKNIIEISGKGIAGAVYIGIFEMGIAFVCWLLAMKKTSSAASIANLIFLAPIFSLGLIHFVVGEEIRLSTIVGLAIILSGLFLQSRIKLN